MWSSTAKSGGNVWKFGECIAKITSAEEKNLEDGGKIADHNVSIFTNTNQGSKAGNYITTGKSIP
jgi:hypothetical protein